ncbi:hypothetical protein OG548_45175 [Streptomyces sp. NBC_01356]|uniref:hypothetical protein n=1 Tax=Streptomyces sp. NBC_01356 TaxID=2903836 RepID=UPI002E32FB13|nr:hypothetical protein [Streptomyces sp. NBC_01356]
MSKDVTTSLTSDEQLTLQRAAYGAVHLVSVAQPGVMATTRANITGAKVLTGATGTVGQILSSKAKIKLKGNTADVAAEVLPALTATTAVLKAKSPADTEEFRTIVTVAVEQAAERAGVSPARQAMVTKITGALAA